ncbi:PD-(D/E)XK nuclease family protein [Candidatus Uhrbacteria bacterium]|nr:PD-(D/E)XK nuclease family protein [Candidatus Uhrbacteria bacterium]
MPRDDSHEPHVPGTLPPYLSVSQVTSWLRCPRAYRYRYLVKREPESRSGNLAFGSAVHSAIEWWQGERIAGREPDVDRALRIFRADWTAQTADSLLDLEDRSPGELQAVGEALVRLFVERFTGETPPGAVEHRFEVVLRDPATGAPLPVPLVGYLDALSDGLAWELKTAARKTAISEYALQLAAYSYAVRETTGVRPRLRVVELIKTKVPKIEVEETMLTDREEAWFVEVAVEVYDAITRGAFPPNPSWMCPRCEYRGACRGTVAMKAAA